MKNCLQQTVLHNAPESERIPQDHLNSVQSTHVHISLHTSTYIYLLQLGLLDQRQQLCVIFG